LPPPCFGDPLLLCFEKGEAAAVSFGRSFLGFFASRLLRFWPFAMALISVVLKTGHITHRISAFVQQIRAPQHSARLNP
jgi:hypothetical protein